MLKQEIPKVSVSKWVFALIIGIPTIAGAYYFIRKASQKTPGQDVNGTCKKPKPKLLPKEETDPVAKPETYVEETPVERAIKLKNAGNGFYKKGEFSDAIRCYTEAISICPPLEKEHMSTLYQNRAAAHELLDHTEEVVNDCTSALLLKPDYLKALSRKYKAEEKLGRMREALEGVTAVCFLEKFNNMETLTAADRILKVIGKSESEKYIQSRTAVLPSDYFMKAYFASFSQDPIMKDIKDLSSAEPVLLHGLDKARRLLLDEKYSGIIAACNEEIEKPKSKENEELALLLRASMYILSCQTQESMLDLTVLINSTENIKIKTSALLKRACLYMQAEDSDHAFEDFENAAQLDPSNPDVPHQRAQMFLLGDKLQEAVSEFQKAVSLNNNSGLILVQKLYAEYRFAMARDDPRQAQAIKSTLEEAVLKYSNTPEGYMLLAQIYSDSQEYDKAESTFDQGIKADGKNASILVHKGLLYLQWKGDMDKAINMMEKAIEIDPKCEFAYETLASIEVQKGNLIRAVTLFDKALPLAKSEREASHILSLRAAAQAQIVVSQTLNLEPLAE